jgi:hypothetical protein
MDETGRILNFDAHLIRYFRCNGGDHADAFEYYTDTGIVTGGKYQSEMGCKPYPLDPDVQTKPSDTSCHANCRSGYQNSYYNDRVFGNGYYSVGSNEKEIMNEIMTHGPVIAQFDLYDDFVYYDSGVYKHESGERRGLSCRYGCFIYLRNTSCKDFRLGNDKIRVEILAGSK